MQNATSSIWVGMSIFFDNHFPMNLDEVVCISYTTNTLRKVGIQLFIFHKSGLLSSQKNA